MTNRRDNPYVYATWLSSLMVGDVTCEWSRWHMANYQYDRLPEGDWSGWRMNHTKLVRELRGERQRGGEQVFLEDQRQFRYRRPGSALVLHGRPDLVSVGRTVTVIDAKTPGKFVRDSDVAQVKIYMYGLRECFPEYRDKQIRGLVAYESGHRVEIDGDEIVGRFEEHLHDWLDVLESAVPPPKVPSVGNCRFCKIGTRDCAERVETDAASDTDEW